MSYSDGRVRIRKQAATDLDADLEAKDEEQIRWMWQPGERERWERMTREQQREHARRGLAANARAFGCGPKWSFAVDAEGESYVAYVDCDLANPNVSATSAGPCG